MLSEPVSFVADYLQFFLATAKIAPLRLIKTNDLEMEVPVLQVDDPANRCPDLVILREEHISLTQERLALSLTMPPPRLIAEVISPGASYLDKDYLRKRAQYAALGVPECWLIDLQEQVILVLELSVENDYYEEFGVFRGEDEVRSPTFGNLPLSAAQLFNAEA